MESVIKFASITVVFLLAHFPTVCLKSPADGIITDIFSNSSKSYISETGPSCPNCGICRRNRIVGGHDASVQEFSWIVTLKYFNVFVCGGSFINSRYVLTAAHCVEGKHPELLKVFNKQFTSFARLEERGFSVQKIVTHASFDPETFDYDIGLLRLNETVYFNAWLKPVCLPFRKSTNFDRQLATVVGWGAPHENASTPQAPRKLHKVKVPVVSNKACRNTSGLRSYLITERMLCAGDVRGGKDACKGDSGGPIMLKKRGQWTQIGIVSWGVGCARPQSYGIYTKLTEFLDWIQGNLEATWGCGFA